MRIAVVAVVLGVLGLAALLLRYEIVPTYGMRAFRLDRWTGRVCLVEGYPVAGVPIQITGCSD